MMFRGILQIASSFYVFLFLLPAIYLAIRLIRFGPQKFRFPFIQIILLFLLIGLAMLWELSGLFPVLDPTRSTYGIVPLFTGTIGFSLFEKAYPMAGANIKEQTLGMAEERNRLKGYDLNDLNSSLIKIMKEERPYLDEDFRLPHLAEMLNLSPQQMSYHLNKNLNKDFHTFICEYRIQDACQLLLEDSLRSVTSIAFAVGFNSRSVFYRVFKEITKQTPGQFRATGSNEIKSADKPSP
jgi:AraC-like DNA-binding protein